jgi:hypothetical protein
MAGGFTEGGYSTVKPIMHPEGKLGFHAPGLMIPSGMYSEDAVQEGYKIALAASARLVELRTTGDYAFSELLFYYMLNTPPDDMFYVDTVGKAVAFDIAVFPVGLDSSSPMASLERLCAYKYNYYASIKSGFDQVFANGIVPVTGLLGEELTAFFQDGFGEEAVSSCMVKISLRKINDVEEYLIRPPIDIEFAGDIAKGAYPYASYAPTTRISELPTDVIASWAEIQEIIGIPEKSGAQFCLFEDNAGLAEVTNVERYANMRSRPDFDSRVVREVPLGEQIRLVENNLLLTGSTAQQQFCQKNCRAFFRNPEDQSAREGSQQCIRDHILWYEIVDSGGNRGWISRNFLQEVE